MSERKTFEVTIGSYDLSLRLGNCACVLFRRQQEVDYLAIDLEDDEEQTLRVFNNPDMVRWMAGFRIIEKEGNVFRQAVLNHENSPNESFRERTGWNPFIIEKEEPNEGELEMFLDVNAADLDKEWRELG